MYPVQLLLLTNRFVIWHQVVCIQCNCYYLPTGSLSGTRWYVSFATVVTYRQVCYLAPGGMYPVQLLLLTDRFVIWHKAVCILCNCYYLQTGSLSGTRRYVSFATVVTYRQVHYLAPGGMYPSSGIPSKCTDRTCWCSPRRVSSHDTSVWPPRHPADSSHSGNGKVKELLIMTGIWFCLFNACDYSHMSHAINVICTVT